MTLLQESEDEEGAGADAGGVCTECYEAGWDFAPKMVLPFSVCI